MPCHVPTSWIYSPRGFPKWAEPEIFGLQSVEESGLAFNFIRNLPRPILDTEIVRRMESAYWVVSQRALCSPYAIPRAAGAIEPLFTRQSWNPFSLHKSAKSFIKAVLNEEPNTSCFMPRSLPVAGFLWT